MSYISISLLSSNLCYLCCFTSSWAVKNVLGAAVREVLNCPKGTPPYNSHWAITWRVSQSHRSRKPPAATQISLDYTWLDQGIWSAWWKVYIKDRWQYNRAIFELLLLSWVKSSNHIELCQDMSRHLKIRWAHVGTTWHHLGQFIGTKSSFYDVLRIDLQVNLSNTIPANDCPIGSDGCVAFTGTRDDLHIAQLTLQAIRVGTYRCTDWEIRGILKKVGGNTTMFIESNSI